MWGVKISREAVRATAGGVLLAVVVAAPAVASAHGLVSAGQQVLGLPGAWAVLVPLVLDAAGLYAAVLALRDTLNGDAGAANRLLVFAYVAASAGLNVWFADNHGGRAAALFYGLASVSAALLWDRTLRAIRRDLLRGRGAVAEPTPRFRLARWVVAPGETWQAWRLAVIEGLTDPAAAVTRVRAAGARPIQAHQDDGGAATRPTLAASPSGEITGLTKADAIRKALDVLGADTEPPAIVEWLANRGTKVPENYVYDVKKRRSRAAGPAPVGELAAVEPTALDSARDAA